MGNFLVSMFGGCPHSNTTFPQTSRTAAGAPRTYIACLDCGREFDYDWQEMRILKPRRAHVLKAREAAATAMCNEV